MKDSGEEKDRSGSVQAVAFALTILERLALTGEPRRVTELAADLDTTKNRIHRHLQTLVHLGYVSKNDSQRYGPGSRLVQLGNAISNKNDLISIARPILRKLRDKLHLTIALSKLVDNRLFIADYLPSPTSLGLNTGPGSELVVHATAQGKVALAFGPEKIRDAINQLGSRLPQRTKRTIADRKKLMIELAAIKRVGWAGSFGENIVGINALAVPICDLSGELFAVVAAVGLSHELPKPPPREVVTLLKKAAEDIQASLFPLPL